MAITNENQQSAIGSGCAGGEVVTLTDEGTLVNGTTKKRQQRVYHDVLGRTVKAEVLNWDGAGPYGTGGSVYSTAVNIYNGRDQIKEVRQYPGSEGAGTPQVTTMTYDGHGRLKTRHVPEQDIGTATAWDYNRDDTIQKVTDARGSVSNFTYNPRHLVTSITYDPSAGITDTSDVSFAYDAAGNRTLMTDGVGSVTYNYNQLSRMTSETRTFTGVGTFALNYSFNLVGELSSIGDSSGSLVNYAYDPKGRLTSAHGSGFQNVDLIVGEIRYRAFDAVKSMSYGNGRSLTVGYNSRQQPSTYAIPGIMQKSYQYYGDGRLKYSQDALDNRYDRMQVFDQAGRLTTALSGPEARGLPDDNNRPYRHSYQYDALDQLTNTSSMHWSSSYAETATYVNRRRTDWTYDAEGNLRDDNTADTQRRAYDAAGRLISITDSALTVRRTDAADGDGQRVKSGYRISGSFPLTYTYYLRSSLFGGEILAEVAANGQVIKRYVRSNEGALLASQTVSENYFIWRHEDPAGQSVRVTDTNGTFDNYPGPTFNAELDPVRADSELEDPYLNQPPYTPPDENDPAPTTYSNPTRPSRGCNWNGMSIPDCSFLLDALPSGNLSLLYMSAAASQQVIGTRTVTERFRVERHGGHPADDLENDIIQVGDVDVYHLTRTTTMPIFDSAWSLFSSPMIVVFPQNHTFDTPGITKLVNQELADPNCAKFAETILNQLSNGKGGSLANVFNAFLNQPKAHDLFTRTAPPGSRGQATAIGSLKNSTAAMFLRRDPNQTVFDANGVIAELFHFAGGPYSDKELAKALNKTSYANEASLAFPDGTANIFDKKNYRPNGWSDADGYSTYFHAIQQRHCGTIPPNSYRNP